MPITRYVKHYAPELAHDYEFGLNPDLLKAKLDVAVPSGTRFEQNLHLKLRLADLWSSPERREEVARYYVSTWGRIRGNKATTLQRYVDTVGAGGCPPFKGIPSWSKVATAADPRRYAIFDARVALSLNAIQFLDKPPAARAQLFPLLSSRNKLISRVAPRLYAEGKRLGWTIVPEADVYATYLNLLKRASSGLANPLPLARAEMVLFARAPHLASDVDRRL